MYYSLDLNCSGILVCRLVCSGGGPTDLLGEYRRMIQGMASSLFIHTLQGRDDVIDYLLDPSLIPLPLTDYDISQWWSNVGSVTITSFSVIHNVDIVGI